MLFQTTIDIRDQFNTSDSYLQLGGPDGDSGSALGSIIGSIVGIAIPLAAIGVLIYTVWAGFNYLTAGGDKARVEEARTRLTNGLIGLAIVASALVISSIINQFFGTNVSITP